MFNLHGGICLHVHRVKQSATGSALKAVSAVFLIKASYVLPCFMQEEAQFEIKSDNGEKLIRLLFHEVQLVKSTERQEPPQNMYCGSYFDFMQRFACLIHAVKPGSPILPLHIL